MGDSITEGRGTYVGEGFMLPVCDELSDMDNIAIEYSNCGWSSQTPINFYARARDIIESEIQPDLLVIPSGSPNGVTTIAADNIRGISFYRSSVIAYAAQKGIKTAMWTWLPTNTAVKNYGSSDSLRVSDNVDIMSFEDNATAYLFDTSSIISGSVVGGQVQMLPGSTDDNIHPNDSGNTLLGQNGFKSILEKILAL